MMIQHLKQKKKNIQSSRSYITHLRKYQGYKNAIKGTEMYIFHFRLMIRTFKQWKEEKSVLIEQIFFDNFGRRVTCNSLLTNNLVRSVIISNYITCIV